MSTASDPSTWDSFLAVFLPVAFVLRVVVLRARVVLEAVVLLFLLGAGFSSGVSTFVSDRVSSAVSGNRSGNIPSEIFSPSPVASLSIGPDSASVERGSDFVLRARPAVGVLEGFFTGFSDLALRARAFSCFSGSVSVSFPSDSVPAVSGFPVSGRPVSCSGALVSVYSCSEVS